MSFFKKILAFFFGTEADKDTPEEFADDVYDKITDREKKTVKAKRFKRFKSMNQKQVIAECEKLLQEVSEKLNFEKTTISSKGQKEEMKTELRGRISGRPIRIFWNYDIMHPHKEPDPPQIQIQCKNKSGLLIDLHREIGKKPVEKNDVDSDWEDEDIDEDEMVVFLDKNIFVEGDQQSIDATVSMVNSLPQELTDKILADMEKTPLSSLTFTNMLYAFFEKSVIEIHNPLNSIIETIQILNELANFLDQGDAVKGDSYKTKNATSKKVTCKYCNTNFIFGATSKCPNCGAPYEE